MLVKEEADAFFNHTPPSLFRCGVILDTRTAPSTTMLNSISPKGAKSLAWARQATEKEKVELNTIGHAFDRGAESFRPVPSLL